jgi:hypothetical protein
VTQQSDETVTFTKDGDAVTFTKGDGTLALLRCPNNHENYAAAVMSGLCAFCDFDANAPQEATDDAE